MTANASPDAGIPAVASPPSSVNAAQTEGPPLRGLRRPSRALLKYYMLLSVLSGPFVIIMMPYRYFRYRTLRYVFDDEGVTMRWGILFRREISLTYARIQDIHLVSNLIERWFGLGRVQIQTASGQSGAEMTVEGQPDFEHVRDELYRRMRGARAPRSLANPSRPAGVDAPASDSALGPGSADLADATAALHAAVHELRAIRETLAKERHETA
jgi:putative membrane protein